MTSGRAATKRAASAICPVKTWSSNTQPSSASFATFSRSTGSFIRSGAAAKRYCSFSCQCSCSRMPRISGEAACWAANMRPASGSNRSAQPTMALGQPVRSWTSCTQRTSSSGSARSASSPARRRRPRRRCRRRRRGTPRSGSRGGSARTARRCAAPSGRSATAGRPGARRDDGRRRSWRLPSSARAAPRRGPAAVAGRRRAASSADSRSRTPDSPSRLGSTPCMPCVTGR